jgi:hypothetical protein
MDAIPGLRDGFIFLGSGNEKSRSGTGRYTSRGCHQALLITPSISEIRARTIRIWIMPPTLYTKTPRSHPISKMTAIKYSKPLIKIIFSARNNCYLPITLKNACQKFM